LIFFDRRSGVIEGVFSQIAEQLAEGFGAMQDLASDKLFYLRKALFPVGQRGNPDYIQFNRSVTTSSSLCKRDLYLV